MTFAEFKQKVLKEAFPLGAPENLSFDDYIVSGLIEAQRWIPCVRYRHDDVIPACETFWHCGATVVTAPRGRILRVYTVDRGENGTDWCHPVPLNPVSLKELRRWQARLNTRWDRSLYLPPSSGRNLPMGFDVPTTSSDAASGRALTGVYAIDPTACRLLVAPWLQTTEAIVIEWQGIKRKWNDLDLVTDDVDFLRLVRLFVDREYGRKWASADLPTRTNAWNEALADLMVTCQEDTKLHGEPATAEEAEVPAYAPYVAPTPTPVPAEETSTKIVFVGDIGGGGEGATEVAQGVAAENPGGWVFLLGDSKTPPNGALVGMAPYESFIADGRLRAALGDNDLNDGALGSDVTSYAGNPGNGRYFIQKIGPVSVFVINSGVNSAGTLVEPDGNYPGSRQWQEIASAILRDTSPWKIAVLHHSPFTSGATYYPGLADIRWVSDLPVHAVVSAHSRNYERLVVRNRPHLVVGTGGLALHNFVETPVPGSVQRELSFGFLRFSATCDAATFEFLTPDGSVLDTVELNAGIAAQPPVLAPDDPRITEQPQDVEVLVGETAAFSVVAEGTDPLAFQWYRGGVAIEGATLSTYEIGSPTALDAGVYTCVVSNGVGAVASAPATLTVDAGMGELPGGTEFAPIIPTIAALRASSVTATLVIVASDLNDASANYVKSDTPGVDDGIGQSVVVNAAGVTYIRK